MEAETGRDRKISRFRRRWYPGRGEYFFTLFPMALHHPFPLFLKGKFPIWVILGGVVFQCGSWISNYSNVGRFGYIRRLHCLTIPIWPFLRPQRLNALHTAYRTTLSMDCHSICDSPITQYSHRRTTSTISRCSTGTTVQATTAVYGTVTIRYRTVPVLPS